jgi:hypothetical protein
VSQEANLYGLSEVKRRIPREMWQHNHYEKRWEDVWLPGYLHVHTGACYPSSLKPSSVPDLELVTMNGGDVFCPALGGGCVSGGPANGSVQRRAPSALCDRGSRRS